MVKQKPQKIVFLYAFLLAVLVFGIGIFIGFSFENVRNNNAYLTYIKSEVALADVKFQNDILNNLDINNCDKAVKDNINFGDEIYKEAQQLSNYEEANKISEVIKAEHKKFDLLRAIFWVNSIKIKNKCNASYINIVYIYKYNNPSIEQKALQEVYSKMLFQIKQQYGDTIILIPIAGDNNLTSINTLLSNYDIDKLPTILINEKTKITEKISIEDIKKIIDKEIRNGGITKLN